MNEVKIDRDVPVPPRHKTGITAIMRKLGVGDSFTYPQNTDFHGYAHFAGIEVTTRKQKDGLVRIWRIK